MKKGLSRCFGWIIGICLIVFMLTRVNAHSLLASLRDFKIETVLGLAILTIVANACQGLRLYALWPEGRVSLNRQTWLPFCMHTANILLPLRLGEALQPLMLKKWKPSLNAKSVVMWVLMDKALEFVSFSPFVAAACFAYGRFEWIALLALVVSHAFFFASLKKLKAEPASAAMAYVLSLMMWVANGLFFALLLKPMSAALALFVGTSVASSVPLAPAGLGTYEAAFAWIARHAGLDPAVAMARALSSHSISILVTIAIGLPLGAIWGWPKSGDIDEPPAGSTAPLRFRITNIFVYVLGVFVILFSGALWIPSKRLPAKNSKGEAPDE